MRVWSSNHTYQKPWDYVTAAFWRKYPNEKVPHVRTVDVLSVSVKGDILRTERLFSVGQSVPSLVAWFFQSDIGYVHETTTVNRATRQVSSVSRNLSFRDLAQVQETVSYSPHPDNQGTQFTQDVEVTVNYSRFSSYIEDFLLSRVKANANKGRQALEQVLARIMLLNK